MESQLPQVVNGIPYAPDVRRLEEAYPSPQEDQVIRHDEFEKLLKIPGKSQRYYGVINTWRKRLRTERNIDSEWLPGIGVKILNPADRLKVSESNVKHGIRHTGRAFRRLAVVPRDRLDAIGQARYDHAITVASKLTTAGRDAQRELAIDLAPVKSLPKPKLVVNE
jgi:hypothetical protein